MNKIKMFILQGVISLLLLSKELFLKDREINENPTFDYFIKKVLHSIYIDLGNKKELIIHQVIFLMCLYIVFFYIFIKLLSMNIENFKEIIKYNSSGLINFFKKTLLFFANILLISTLQCMTIFVASFSILYRDYNYNNYIIGILAVLKLPLFFGAILLLTIIFPIKKMVVLILIISFIKIIFTEIDI